MATPTSSSNRSKRKTNKPVTKGQDPQRANRQKVSNAKVSNSDQRTSTGTAKVTTGKGGPKPKALPPAGQSGGSKPPKGTSAPQRGGPPLTPQQQAQQRRAAAAAKKAGAGAGTRSNTATPMPGSNRVSGVRRIGGGLVAGTALTAAAGKAIETLGRAANPNEWRRVQQELKDRGYGGRAPVNKDPNGRSSRGVNTSNGRTVATGSQQYNDYRNQQIAAERARLKGVGNPPAAKPKPPAPTQSGGGSTQSRSGGGGGSSRPAAPSRQAAAQSAPQSGPKRVSAATANRESGNYGTSRTNNPLIDADMKARMRQREDREGVGPVKDGARYAADVKNTTKGVGPVANSDTYSSALKQKSGSEKLKEAQAKLRDEQQRRRRYNG